MLYTDLLLSIVWPLIVLLLALVVLRQVQDGVRPIFINVVRGVAQSAQSNAPAYAIAILFGLSASASAFIDVFNNMTSADLKALSWHQYACQWVRILNPFIVAILAYATQNKFKASPGTTSTTTTSTTENTPAPNT